MDRNSQIGSVGLALHTDRGVAEARKEAYACFAPAPQVPGVAQRGVRSVRSLHSLPLRLLQDTSDGQGIALPQQEGPRLRPRHPGPVQPEGRAQAPALACRACARAKDIKFVDGPQSFSRHYVEPKDGITPDCSTCTSRSTPRAGIAEARPRERGRLLHPRRRGLRDPRRHPLRLESGRRRHRAQQLRAPALQREPRRSRRARWCSRPSRCSCS